jgi:hypothetical protein
MAFSAVPKDNGLLAFYYLRKVFKFYNIQVYVGSHKKLQFLKTMVKMNVSTDQ